MSTLIDLETNKVKFTIETNKKDDETYILFRDPENNKIIPNLQINVDINKISWDRAESIEDGKKIPNPFHKPLQLELKINEKQLANITNINDEMKKAIEPTLIIKSSSKKKYSNMFKKYFSKETEISSTNISVTANYKNKEPDHTQITTSIRIQSYPFENVERVFYYDNKNKTDKYILKSDIPENILAIFKKNYKGGTIFDGAYYIELIDYENELSSEYFHKIIELINQKGQKFNKYNDLNIVKQHVSYKCKGLFIVRISPVYNLAQYYGVTMKCIRILITESIYKTTKYIDFIMPTRIITSDEEDVEESKPMTKKVENNNEKPTQVKATKKEVEIDSDSDEPKLQQVKSTKKVEVDSESDDPKPVKAIVTKKVAQVESDGSDSEPKPPVKVTKKPTKKVAQVESDGSDSEPEPVKVTTKAKSKK